MGPNRRQKQELQNQEFCKNYLTADWDGCAANEYFALNCDPNPEDKFYGKPNDEFFNGMREIYIAEKQVYFSIANKAFTKDKILDFLTEVNADKVPVPEKINDKERFLRVYLNTCKEILAKINSQSYDFQKPKS
jgi:hypothetical protein